MIILLLYLPPPEKERDREEPELYREPALVRALLALALLLMPLFTLLLKEELLATRW